MFLNKILPQNYVCNLSFVLTFLLVSPITADNFSFLYLNQFFFLLFQFIVAPPPKKTCLRTASTRTSLSNRSHTPPARPSRCSAPTNPPSFFRMSSRPAGRKSVKARLTPAPPVSRANRNSPRVRRTCSKGRSSIRRAERNRAVAKR